MTERLFFRVLLLVLSWTLTFSSQLSRADVPAASVDKSALTHTLDKPAKPVHVEPGAQDGRIAFYTAKLLEKFHYLQHPLDEPMGTRFFDRYIDSLDPQHLHFLQSDLNEFERYRTNLQHLTVGHHGDRADVRPASEIFNRFMQRFDQRVDYAEELLKNEKFEFDADERITINRHELAAPANLTEAKKLWRDRLRFEYLQEKLGKTNAKKKPSKEAIKTAPKASAEEIADTLIRRYRRSLRTFADWNNEDVLQVYLSALARIYDPHSDYMGRSV